MWQGSPIFQGLHTRGLAPFSPMDITFAERINLITGDNGLGKSLILDLAFWQLTATWPNDTPLRPSGEAQVSAVVAGETPSEVTRTATYDSSKQRWSWSPGRRPIPGLVIYARANGSFCVWDPAKNYYRDPLEGDLEEYPRAFIMSQSQVWDGLQGPQSTWLCNGLIRDWVSWQRTGQFEFSVLEKVLRVLSPSPREILKPAPPASLNPDDDRVFPMLDLPYGQIPAMHASEAVRRIVGLAYLIVWAWAGHRRAAELRNSEPIRRLVVLVDEIEAHLHPKWQRRILPALLSVVNELNPDASIQLIAVTHAPLLLASMEPEFNPERDQLLTIDLADPTENRRVEVKPGEFFRRGSADEWLISDVFDLPTARSLEAEQAIREAERWLDSAERSNDERARVDSNLRRTLSDTDRALRRWEYAMEKLHEGSQSSNV